MPIPANMKHIVKTKWQNDDPLNESRISGNMLLKHMYRKPPAVNESSSSL